VLALQDEQIAEHGGSAGLRNEALLDSALDRPKNQFIYGTPDLFDLSAAYAFGLARNHPGNKRISLVVAKLFLEINNQEIATSDEELTTIWLGLAAGDISESDLAEWLREHAT
jgi:death on curing protein